MPSSWSRHLHARFILHQLLLLDVGTHAAHADAVDIVQVIAKIEFIEVKWDDEGRECWGMRGCPEEREGKVWSVRRVVRIASID